MGDAGQNNTSTLEGALSAFDRREAPKRDAGAELMRLELRAREAIKLDWHRHAVKAETLLEALEAAAAMFDYFADLMDSDRPPSSHSLKSRAEHCRAAIAVFKSETD